MFSVFDTLSIFIAYGSRMEKTCFWHVHVENQTKCNISVKGSKALHSNQYKIMINTLYEKHVSKFDNNSTQNTVPKFDACTEKESDCRYVCWNTYKRIKKIEDNEEKLVQGTVYACSCIGCDKVSYKAKEMLICISFQMSIVSITSSPVKNLGLEGLQEVVRKFIKPQLIPDNQESFLHALQDGYRTCDACHWKIKGYVQQNNLLELARPTHESNTSQRHLDFGTGSNAHENINTDEEDILIQRNNGKKKKKVVKRKSVGQKIQTLMQFKNAKLNYRRVAYSKLKSERQKQERDIEAYAHLGALAAKGDTNKFNIVDTEMLIKSLSKVHEAAKKMKDEAFKETIEKDLDMTIADDVMFNDDGTLNSNTHRM